MAKKPLKNSEPKKFIEKVSYVIVGVIIFTIIISATVILYANGKISFIVLRALLFFYSLSLVLLIIRIYFMYYVNKFAKSLGFKVITPFYMQPKLEGIYKNNWWQIHFVNKETGTSPAILRTYIKLQWKTKKKFAEQKFRKYDNLVYKGSRIISINHIVRETKNYLLLKKAWFSFDKKHTHKLMDLLLKISKEAEIKK